MSYKDRGLSTLMPSECPYCQTIFGKRSIYGDVCRHIYGRCKETSDNIQFHVDAKCINTSPELRMTYEEFENKRKENNLLKMYMIAFGKGWWKGWRAGLIGGLLLGSMWMWIAIEVWRVI